MVKVTSKDKLLQVVGVDSVAQTEKSEEVEQKPESVEQVYEEEKTEVAVQSDTEKVDPPQHIVLTELEYGAVSKTLNTLQNLKDTVSADSEEAKAQINLLEVSIWDDIVKRFGFESVESASEAGFTFGLRRLYVAECSKK